MADDAALMFSVSQSDDDDDDNSVVSSIDDENDDQALGDEMMKSKNGASNNSSSASSGSKMSMENITHSAPIQHNPTPAPPPPPPQKPKKVVDDPALFDPTSRDNVHDDPGASGSSNSSSSNISMDITNFVNNKINESKKGMFQSTLDMVTNGLNRDLIQQNDLGNMSHLKDKKTISPEDREKEETSLLSLSASDVSTEDLSHLRTIDPKSSVIYATGDNDETRRLKFKKKLLHKNIKHRSKEDPYYRNTFSRKPNEREEEKGVWLPGSFPFETNKIQRRKLERQMDGIDDPDYECPLCQLGEDGVTKLRSAVMERIYRSEVCLDGTIPEEYLYREMASLFNEYVYKPTSETVDNCKIRPWTKAIVENHYALPNPHNKKNLSRNIQDKIDFQEQMQFYIRQNYIFERFTLPGNEGTEWHRINESKLKQWNAINRSLKTSYDQKMKHDELKFKMALQIHNNPKLADILEGLGGSSIARLGTITLDGENTRQYQTMKRLKQEKASNYNPSTQYMYSKDNVKKRDKGTLRNKLEDDNDAADALAGGGGGGMRRKNYKNDVIIQENRTKGGRSNNGKRLSAY
jgi:hypothetical protein